MAISETLPPLSSGPSDIDVPKEDPDPEEPDPADIPFGTPEGGGDMLEDPDVIADDEPDPAPLAARAVVRDPDADRNDWLKGLVRHAADDPVYDRDPDAANHWVVSGDVQLAGAWNRAAPGLAVLCNRVRLAVTRHGSRCWNNCRG